MHDIITRDPRPTLAARADTVIISWNLLRTTGASIDDVIRLIRDEQPDLLLMQEATMEIDRLADRIGGHYARSPLPGRILLLDATGRVVFFHDDGYSVGSLMRLRDTLAKQPR